MYEKTYQAWEELKKKFSARRDKQFEEASEEEKRALIVKFDKVDKDAISRKEQEFAELIGKLRDSMQEMAYLTEYSGHRMTMIQRYTGTLNRLVRDFIPDTFGFEREDMDKIIRAMEIDRRAEQRRDTLEGMPYEHYLQTTEWKMRREQALRDAGNKCQLCYTPKFLEVHHKTYQRRGHELPGDLIVLCNDCHSKHHDKIGKENTRNFR